MAKLWRRCKKRSQKVGPQKVGPQKDLRAVAPDQFLQAEPPQRRGRGLVSDDATPFSWLQCSIATFAYVWLLSNFVRTGFAIHNLDAFHTFEPQVYSSFGPYAYPVSSFYRNSDGADVSNVTSADPVALWSYKYDTTSLAIRTFAQFLNVSAFPDCVFYRGKCNTDFLTPATALVMLDSLVDAVRNTSTQHPRVSKLPTQDPKYKQLQPQKLLLRASYEFFDRVHHYLLSQLFTTPSWRTCEALYYSPELLSLVAASSSIHSASKAQEQGTNATLVDICSHAYGGIRPYFCDDVWTHFNRSCPASDTECRAVGHVSSHTIERLKAFKASYPDATVDMLVLGGDNDIAVHRGGFAFVGKHGFDVVTIFRARACSSSEGEEVCETQVLEDYRYEGETCTTDVLQWYPLIMTLRGTAQTYYWLRLIMLYGGCYFAAKTRNTSDTSASVFSTVRRALVLFFKIPSQVVIYGSAFPVVCYALAHTIDATIVYELIAGKFDSFNGLFQLSLAELITVSSLQMRNVWLLANVMYVVVKVLTWREWSPLQGVWGMPQFSIALISSLTIFSQFRFLSLRWTPIKSIIQVQVTSHVHPVIESLFHVNGGGGKGQLSGVFIDTKSLVCSTVAIAVVATLITLIVRFGFRKSKLKLILWRSHSATPLSAGVLWSPRALAVSWNDDVFQFHHAGGCNILRCMHLASSPLSSSHTKIHPAQVQPDSKTPVEKEIETLDNRSEADESAMFLMNITMLSDPLTYLCWRWYSSTTFLGYYRSPKTHQVYLVPLIHMTHRSDELNWKGFALEKTVPADKLTWRELVSCG